MNSENFFKDIFRNARENSLIIMDSRGYIIKASRSFTTSFGYSAGDIAGKHFRMLFTTADRKIKKPENEIKVAIAEGSKSDNNYLVHKDGSLIWVMGESVSVKHATEKYLVKIIHNIHAQKQLERFLMESNEFVDTIFDSIKDTSLIILDSALKVVKSNKAFNKMFSLRSSPVEGSRLTQIENDFWKDTSVRKKLLDSFINRQSIKNERFTYKPKKGSEKHINIDSKLMDGDANEKKILLVIKFAEI
ncbi:MAG: PAS domain-containing protein [Ferruginibacter sp.]